MPLNINDVFPRLPIGGDDYSLLNKFKSDVLPLMRQNRVDQIGNGVINQPVMHHEPQQTRADFADNSPLRPGYTPPNLNVVYKAPMSDQIATRMLGIGQGEITPVQQAGLDLKSRALDQSGTKIANTAELNNNKLGISQQRADTYDFKAKNPGSKFQLNKLNGHLEALDPISNKVTDLGASELGEQDLIDLNQKNSLAKISATGEQNRQTQEQGQQGKETLAEIAARHAIELAKAKADLNNGTTTTEKVTDANGQPLGTRTKTTTPNKAKTVQMYGPDGSGPYSIPADKVDDAKKTHNMSETKPVAKAK